MSQRGAESCIEQSNAVNGVGGSSSVRGDGTIARRLLGIGASMGNMAALSMLSMYSVAIGLSPCEYPRVQVYPTLSAEVDQPTTYPTQW
jgi:hypothetical protein